MIYHVLNGDALIERFVAADIRGETAVARECLVEGDLHGDTLPEFWRTRAKYIAKAVQSEEAAYFNKVVTEFNKLLSAPDNSEFNLWFGYDLFCRANMWFVISLLQSLPGKKEIFAVYPSFLAAPDIWEDFGTADIEDLRTAFKNRIRFSEADIKLAGHLWDAYKANDLKKLEELSTSISLCFPYLKEVCRAHIDRFPLKGIGRPEQAVEDIFETAGPDFYSVFKEFSKRKGVYGFGDLQLKPFYDKVYDRRSN